MSGSADCTPIMFSQYAQDPLEGFDEQLEQETTLSRRIVDAITNPIPKKRKGKVTNRIVKRSSTGRPPSFVINNDACKGNKLVRIQIIDISCSVPDTSKEDDDNVLLSAQYVASDGYDEVIENAEGLINKISKKICGYSVSY